MPGTTQLTATDFQHDTANPFGAIRDGERHEIYRQLARHGAPRRISTPSGAPAWVVTDQRQVRQVLTDARFVKAESPATAVTRALVPELAAGLTSHMLTVDPPDHTRLRRLVGAVFTRRRVDELAPRIQQIADLLLDELPYHSWNGHGVVDLIPTYALPLPMTVICELIGVPEPDRNDFRTWSNVLASGYFAEPDEFARAATDQIGYVRALVEDKRRHPQDDLLSALVALSDDGDQLSQDELTSMVWVLVLAGHETTVNLITSGVHALVSHPNQLAVLHTNPGLIDNAVEELLRFHSPLQVAIPLRAAESVDIGGVRIEPGEVVLPALLAANRDPSRIADPDRLDITRTNNHHVAFGHGIHHCLGAPLARLEGRIALSTLLTRYPHLRLAEAPDAIAWRENFLIHGLTCLPIALG